ncbi:hypothetical protein IKG73_01300 [Candidatus Saccharibacteria bacterium]|nr:hypothetical protein [Candidatus Saccharibacteria bacterium]
MNKIIIEKILQKKVGNKTKLSFDLKINKKSFTLWYEIGCEDYDFSDGIENRIDAVVATFLIFAMKKGYDFYSEYPISERLYYNLTYHVIPQLNVCNPTKTKKISIFAPLCKANGKKKYNFVATGVSCGVDSLATIYEYSELCELEDYKLTHLVYFKTGAHDGQIGRFDKKVENDLFNGQVKKAVDFSQKAGFPLVVIDSNLNEVLSEAFGFTNYDMTHTFRSVGVMLLLQDYFSLYYYADAYNLDRFSINVDEDTAHYDKWLLPMLSNENIRMYSANKDMVRFDKTKLLTEYSLSYDNLLVCWTDEENCGKCNKCIRTLVTLDLLGKLDLYNKSFNLEDYYKNKDAYISKVIRLRKEDFLFDEIVQRMEVSKFKLFKCDLRHFFGKVLGKVRGLFIKNG